MKTCLRGFYLHWDVERGDLCFEVAETITQRGKKSGSLFVGWISLDNMKENGMVWHPVGENLDPKMYLKDSYHSLNLMLDDIAKVLLAEEARESSEKILESIEEQDDKIEDTPKDQLLPGELTCIEEWVATLPEKTGLSKFPKKAPTSQKSPRVLPDKKKKN